MTITELIKRLELELAANDGVDSEVIIESPTDTMEECEGYASGYHIAAVFGKNNHEETRYREHYSVLVPFRSRIGGGWARR